MSARSQKQAITMLMDAASHALSEPVEQIETHISRIFLAGDRAYKMKRAVLFPYADFSTPELRLAACLKEVELNSMTAPGLYLGVRRITRETDGKLVFDGDGELVDAVDRDGPLRPIEVARPNGDGRSTDARADDRNCAHDRALPSRRPGAAHIERKREHVSRA